MPFADNALGFVLQLDDQLTPALNKAEKNYLRVTKELEAANEKLNKVAKGVAEHFEQINKALKALPRLASIAKRSIGDQGLVGALAGPASMAARYMGKRGPGKGAIKLTPEVPIDRNPFFFWGGRKAYRKMLQPPNYTLNVPALAEGGIIKKPTLVMAGEAGPEAIMPLEDRAKTLADVPGMGPGELGKAIPALESLMKAARETKGLAGAAREIEDIIEDGILATDEFSRLQKALTTILKQQTAAGVKYGGTLAKAKGAIKALEGPTAAWSERLVEQGDAMSGAVEQADDLSEGMMKLLQATGKSERASARMFKRVAGLRVSLDATTASIVGTAGMMVHQAQEADTAWTRMGIAIQGTGADVDAMRREAIALSAEMGMSQAELGGVIQQAARFKYVGEEFKTFVSLVGRADIALEAFGATGEQIGQFTYIFESITGSMEGVEGQLSALAYAASTAEADFGVMMQQLEANAHWFREIKRQGGDAEKAMAEFAGVSAAFQNLWVDSEETQRMMVNMLDPSKIEENAKVVNMVLSSTGQTWEGYRDILMQGEFGQAGELLMQGIQALDRRGIQQFGEAVQEIYGVSLDTIQKIQAGDITAFQNIIAGTEEARREAKLMQEMYEKAQQTFARLWERLRNRVIPVLMELGGPVLEGMITILGPFVDILGATVGWFVRQDNILKDVVLGVVGFTIALTAANVVVRTFGLRVAFTNSLLAIKATVLGVVSTAQKIYNLEIWKSIGATIKNIAVTVAYHVALNALIAAYWIQIGAQKLLTAVTWLFNASLWANVGAFLKNTAALVANTIAMGVLAIAYGAAAVAQGIWTGIMYIATAAMWLFNAALMANPIVWIVVGVIALIAAIAGLISYLSEGMSFFEALGEVIMWALGIRVVQLIIDNWSKITGFFSDLFEGIWEIVRTAMVLILDWMLLPVQGFIWAANHVIELIPGLDPIPMLSGEYVLGMIGLQEGGIVTAATAAVIGEAGPEAVIPLTETGGVPVVAGEQPVNVVVESDSEVTDLLRQLVTITKRATRGGGLMNAALGMSR